MLHSFTRPNFISLVTAGFLLAALACPGAARADAPGGLFVTCHDPDFHSRAGFFNPLGAQHILQKAIGYVTGNHANPTILLVTDLRDPIPTTIIAFPDWLTFYQANSMDPRLGMTWAGFPTFDVGTPFAAYPPGYVFPPNAVDLATLNFRSYDCVVIASDFGGWLKQDELDVLNSRKIAIADALRHNVGMVVLAETGSRPPFFYTVPIYRGTSHDRFGFIPYNLMPVVIDQPYLSGYEFSHTLTAAGLALGLVTTDVNGNYSESYFDSADTMDVLERDIKLKIISVAKKNP